MTQFASGLLEHRKPSLIVIGGDGLVDAAETQTRATACFVERDARTQVVVDVRQEMRVQFVGEVAFTTCPTEELKRSDEQRSQEAQHDLTPPVARRLGRRWSRATPAQGSRRARRAQAR